LGALVFLFWKRIDPSYGYLALTGLAASVLLVFLSRDVTSLLILVLMLLLIPYLRKTLRSTMVWAVGSALFLGIAACMSALYMFAHLREVTSLMGKDPMLTGRVPLWIFSTFMALRRPWLGYGFDAFWLPSQPYTQKIWHLLRWMPPHAHNGLLELWLELGLLGMGLFILVFLFYLQKAVRVLRLHAHPEAAWPLVFLLFLFLANLTETAFLVTNSIYFFLFVTVALTCSRDLALHGANKPCEFDARYV
jgi:O-antigen ligase